VQRANFVYAINGAFGAETVKLTNFDESVIFDSTRIDLLTPYGRKVGVDKNVKRKLKIEDLE
jgi:hypothetical protein